MFVFNNNNNLERY